MRFHVFIIRHEIRVRLYSVHDFKHQPSINAYPARKVRYHGIPSDMPYSTYRVPLMTYSLSWFFALYVSSTLIDSCSDFRNSDRAFFEQKSCSITVKHATGWNSFLGLIW